MTNASSLPCRQLRNVFDQMEARFNGSLPCRQLRKFRTEVVMTNAIVHCRVGSSENQGLAGRRVNAVHCRVGSSEKRRRARHDEP